MGYAFGGTSIKDDKYLNKNKSNNKSNNREKRKDLQKKLNKLQSIDKPSGSDRAKIIALKRRIENLKNPRDAKTIAQIQQASKERVKSKMDKRDKDFQKYKKGDISKEKFISRHKDSQTAKKHKLKIEKRNNQNKKRKKDYSKEPLFSRLNDALFKGI
tara:strand:+ start:124 stop:597 length:474 start_codon:yes stop_codon:yes gene_type:complete